MPTAAEIYETDRVWVTIGGKASDNVRVRGVRWTNDRGGRGTATGTEVWLAAIRLVKGTNTITIRAYDAAGNSTVRKIYIKLSKVR
jgi:hypothetical protein